MKLIRVKTTKVMKKKDGAKKIEGFSIKSDGYMWKPSGSGNNWQTKSGSYTFVLIAYGGDYIHDGLTVAYYTVPTFVNDFIYQGFAEIGMRSGTTPDYTLDFLNKVLSVAQKKDSKVAAEVKKVISVMKPVVKSAEKLYDFLTNKSYIEI